MNKNKHRGGDLREYLRGEGVLEEVEARSVKRALALKLAALAREQSVSKSEMAARMKNQPSGGGSVVRCRESVRHAHNAGQGRARARAQSQN